jgi:hypothetical protein
MTPYMGATEVIMAERKPQNPRVRKSTIKTVEMSKIARRAYELYLARGGVHGRDVEDWLAAEQELRGN